MRGAGGELHDLHSVTKAALAASSCPLYCDAVLKTVAASAAVRAGRQMAAASKLVTTHQNVVVACRERVLDAAACRKLGIRAREES